MNFGESPTCDFTSPVIKAYIRGVCRNLFDTPFMDSSVYGTYLVLDGFIHKGGGVYIICLDKKYRPIKQWICRNDFFYDNAEGCGKIEQFADSCGAVHVIIALKGNRLDYFRHLSLANFLYENLKRVKLYDYVTVEKGSFRSLMENLR